METSLQRCALIQGRNSKCIAVWNGYPDIQTVKWCPPSLSNKHTVQVLMCPSCSFSCFFSFFFHLWGISKVHLSLTRQLQLQESTFQHLKSGRNGKDKRESSWQDNWRVKNRKQRRCGCLEFWQACLSWCGSFLKWSERALKVRATASNHFFFFILIVSAFQLLKKVQISFPFCQHPKRESKYFRRSRFKCSFESKNAKEKGGEKRD